MAIFVGRRGLIRRNAKKHYFGYKVYGRTGWNYSRNKRINRLVWGR